MVELQLSVDMVAVVAMVLRLWLRLVWAMALPLSVDTVALRLQEATAVELFQPEVMAAALLTRSK